MEAISKPDLSARDVPNINARYAGFTRLELAVILVAVALLATVVLPALASSRPHSRRAACLNNLSRIGQAYSMWTTEHGGLYPWQSFTSGGGGGGQPFPLNNTWFQFAVLSNELTTPKILVCPSDESKRQALDFSLNLGGGFLNANYRDNAVSYILGHPFLQEGRSVLSGDRNFVPNGGFGSSCPYFVSSWRISNPVIGVNWTTNLHMNTGNLLFNDGSVEQTDSAGLRAGFSNGTFDNAWIHLIYPDPPI